MEKFNETDKIHNFDNLYKLKIIPTIDISQGRAVLVCQGKIISDNGDPFERAEFLSLNSDFQIVDLDRAMETGDNSSIIKKICDRYPCYVAGGIRNLDIALDFLNSNAKRIVIGTALNKEFISKLPKKRTIVAFDIDENFNIYKRGRKELTLENLFDKLIEFSDYISMITITFHHNEGKGEGTDFEKIKIIQNFILNKGYKIRIAVAGGINSVEQIKELIDMNIIPQFGYGLWNNLFSLGDIYSNIINYDKIEKYYKFTENNLKIIVPCIIQGIDGCVLGLTYTDFECIKESINTRKCVFYSRERQTRWLKGETSGNIQTIISVGFNCDRTALIYIVKGGDFCHLNKYSCFNHKNPSEGSLLCLEKYINNSIVNNNSSYTKKIYENKKYNICKILEESLEVWTSNNKNEIIHEISDLLYFSILYTISNNIEIKEIHNELIKRNRKINKEKVLLSEIDKGIKLGICINKHCEKEIFKYLDKIGIFINQPKNLRTLKYEGYFINYPNIKLCPFLVKPKDVANLMENDIIDAVVCYKDIVENYPVNYVQIIINNENNIEIEKKTKICVISKKNFELINYESNPNKKLRIFSEYIKLTKIWIDKKKINGKIFPISGHAEGYLTYDVCDVVVCVVDTGNTIFENDLVIVDTICENGLGLFTKNEEVKEKIEKLIF